MFAVRSLPRVSRTLSSLPSTSSLAPAQRTFWKGLLGIVPKQTPEEAAQSKEDAVPLMQGPGTPLGAVPTDYEQATGIERYQMLGNMAGIDVFDQKPIMMDRMGTMQDPITVNGVIDNRIIGCSGYPVDSHDLQWFTLKAGTISRCTECGCAYELTYHNPWAAVIPSVAEEAKGAKPLIEAGHGHHDDHSHGHEHKSAH